MYQKCTAKTSLNFFPMSENYICCYSAVNIAAFVLHYLRHCDTCITGTAFVLVKLKKKLPCINMTAFVLHYLNHCKTCNKGTAFVMVKLKKNNMHTHDKNKIKLTAFVLMVVCFLS